MRASARSRLGRAWRATERELVFHYIPDALVCVATFLARLVSFLIDVAGLFRRPSVPAPPLRLQALIAQCPACGGMHAGPLAFPTIGALGPYGAQCPSTGMYVAVAPHWILEPPPASKGGIAR